MKLSSYSTLGFVLSCTVFIFRSGTTLRLLRAEAVLTLPVKVWELDTFSHHLELLSLTLIIATGFRFSGVVFTLFSFKHNGLACSGDDA